MGKTIRKFNDYEKLTKKQQGKSIRKIKKRKDRQERKRSVRDLMYQ